MTDPLTLEMKMRQKLAEAEGTTAKGEPKLEGYTDDDPEKLTDYWYARGIQDTIELLLPDVIHMRKVREWLKDWTLSMPLEDIESFVSGGAKLE